MGCIIPEAEKIYYGLLRSPYSEEFEVLRNKTSFVPHSIYYDIAYYNSNDLIKYLSNDNSLSDEYINKMKQAAHQYYDYMPCSETMLRHAIIEAAFVPFIKSITLLFPWEPRPIDLAYIMHITPKEIHNKIEIVYGNLLQVVEENHHMEKTEFSYTTIVCNSIEDINTMIDDQIKYNIPATFFLLRNHSGNVQMITTTNKETGKEEVYFEEMGSYEIFSKLINVDLGVPKSAIRFARYEPFLFKDKKPKNEAEYL